jgi:hypothetical protein
MKINKLLIAFSILVATAMVACSEYEDTVEPSPTVSADNPAVRFYSGNPELFELDPDGLSFSLLVVRDKGTGSIDVPITEVSDTADVFNVPGTISFPSGTDTVAMEITVDPSAPYIDPIGLEVAVGDDQYTNPYKAEYPSFATAVAIEPPCLLNEVFLNLVFDGYASECTWELTDDEGTVIASGGPWEDGTASAEAEFCLDDGTYTFTIYDAYGDGLSYPENGSATITSNGEQLVYIEGDFGESDSGTFTLGE